MIDSMRLLLLLAFSPQLGTLLGREERDVAVVLVLAVFLFLFLFLVLFVLTLFGSLLRGGEIESTLLLFQIAGEVHHLCVKRLRGFNPWIFQHLGVGRGRTRRRVPLPAKPGHARIAIEPFVEAHNALNAVPLHGGNVDSALAYYQQFVMTPAAGLEGAYGPGATQDMRAGGRTMRLGPSYKRLGELYEQRGDRAKAVDYYHRFTELWKDADAELQPLVRDVKMRIARLTKEP